MGIIVSFSPFLDSLTNHCCLCFLLSKSAISLKDTFGFPLVLKRQTLIFLTPTFLFSFFHSALFLLLSFALLFSLKQATACLLLSPLETIPGKNVQNLGDLMRIVRVSSGHCYSPLCHLINEAIFRHTLGSQKNRSVQCGIIKREQNLEWEDLCWILSLWLTSYVAW